MFIIVDERELVTNGYACRFHQEGVASAGFGGEQFIDWVDSAIEGDLRAVEAFLIGECAEREELPKLIRRRSQAPVIALNESVSLEQTLGLFSSGVDDVVRKPVHIKELLARVHAIRRRTEARQDIAMAGPIQVFFDGRDPRVKGEPRAVQFLIFGDDIEQKVEIERGAPSGIFDVFASVRAEQIIGEGA